MERPDRATLLLPGAGQVDFALLSFAALAVDRRGASWKRVWWSPPSGGLVDRIAWVRDQAVAALDEMRADRPQAATRLVVGKSLGSLAARVAADRGLPAIWLTPLLHKPELAAQYEGAAAPTLLIGGTTDPMWDGGVARRLSSHVVEIPDADHGMFVPGSLAESGRAHGEVGAAIERFLDEVVWPS